MRNKIKVNLSQQVELIHFYKCWTSTNRFIKFQTITIMQSQDFLTDPPLPNILDIFKGGGSVQNLDPSGACGGLLKKMNFTFHITVQSLEFIQNYKLNS